MAENLQQISEFQGGRGLPRVDMQKTRQNVKLLFAVYRQYKANFEFGQALELEPVPELEKYKYADDPRTRHAVNTPTTGTRPPDDREIMMRDFMRDVERGVWRLPALQKSIIQYKFMGAGGDVTEELGDSEVLDKLADDGILISETTLNRAKQKAMLLIASALHVTAYQE